MTESLITIMITGLIAGFVLSMPIAGPISILITSNALKGRSRYCNLVSIGASFGTVAYVFLSVFGLTRLFPFFKPFLPYLFSIGSIFLFFLGYRLLSTKLDIEHLEVNNSLTKRFKNQGKRGFYTGFMINFLNPTLLFGWFASTFFVITFVTSLGFNTGGLDRFIHRNAKEINRLERSISEESQDHHYKQNETLNNQDSDSDKADEPAGIPINFHLLISMCYSFFVAIGSIIWFYLLTYLIIQFRQHINIWLISMIINSLGFVICLFGLYFGYMAARIFISA